MPSLRGTRYIFARWRPPHRNCRANNAAQCGSPVRDWLPRESCFLLIGPATWSPALRLVPSRSACCDCLPGTAVIDPESVPDSMKKRRRFKQTTLLKDRLASFSEQTRGKASELRPGQKEKHCSEKPVRPTLRRISTIGPTHRVCGRRNNGSDLGTTTNQPRLASAHCAQCDETALARFSGPRARAVCRLPRQMPARFT